ncbi:hypothetical protein JQX13_23065 [Archangium violaceum]|uniref:hypothetical protein n=1 Tax=Archangium violaceum TaxID=83451 RepID=UPI00193BB623|nr:hypothetical protein [Archangium violaceum]QRK12658.1 hypothetical protein JQX13_23065 [Archangium violaceum]
MDEKKAEASSEEELEQLGPYRLEEQVPQSADSQGELYLASHEASGATALVLKPSEEDKVPLKDWRVLISSSDSARYVAMQVEQTPWAVSPEKQSVESLVFTFEGMLEGVRRMARAIPSPYEPRPLLRLGLSLASAAAVCALVFALVHLASVPQPPSGPEPLASTSPAPMSDEVSTVAGTPDPFDIGTLVDTSDAGESSVLARPLPREPFKGQKRPPCTRYAEVELIGACWTPHKLKAPCPDVLYEYQGECYVPAFSAKPPPQSLGL